MAITAKFNANFSSFSEACNRAVVTLKQFESDAGKVQTALTRMSNAFTGREIIQQALLMAKAIENAGGVTVLTERELQKVGRTAAEAAEKMRKLGQDVPHDLQVLATHVQTQSTMWSRLKDQIISTAAGFLTAQTAINLARDAYQGLKTAITSTIAFGSQIDDLSKATRIGAEDLQALGFAGKRVGLELGDVALVVEQLARRIATGDPNAVSAIARLGLNLQTLKASNPMDMFVAVGEAVNRMTDPVHVATDLFGKQFPQALRLFKDDLRGTMAEAKSMGAVLSQENVESLDRFGDKVEDVTTQLKVMVADALTPTLDKMLQMLQLGGRRPMFIDPKDEDTYRRIGLALGGTDDKAKNLGRSLTIVGTAAKTLAAGGEVTPQMEAERQLAYLREEANRRLTAEQQAYLEGLYDVGQLTQQNADLMGISAAQLDVFKDKETQTIALQTMLTDLLRTEADLYEKIGIAGAKMTDELNRDAGKRLEAINAETQALRQRLALELAQAGGGAAPATAFEQAMQTREGAYAKAAAIESTGANLDVAAMLRQRAEQQFTEAILKLGSAATETSRATEGLGRSAIYGAVSTYGLASAFDQFRGEVAGGPTGPTARTLEEAWRSDFIPGVFRRNVGIGMFGNLGMPTRGFQEGGPVGPGGGFVHEGEYVIPKGGALVGGGGVNLTLHVYGATGQDFQTLADRIKEEIVAGLRRTGARR